MTFKAEIVDQPLTLAPNLNRVARERGALRASGVTLECCDCCGEIKILFVDEARQIFAWIGLSPDAARAASDALLEAAAASEIVAGRTGLHRHKH